MRIAVKFCGGCNPAIDRANLVGKLASLLVGVHPDWELVSINEDVYDAIILLNGCPVGCVQKQFLDEKRPVFLIAGESLQRERIDEEELPAALLAKILRLGSMNGENEKNSEENAL